MDNGLVARIFNATTGVWTLVAAFISTVLVAWVRSRPGLLERANERRRDAAALAKTVASPCWFIWLDFATDPLRVTTFGSNVTLAGIGDPDLDGNSTSAIGSGRVKVLSYNGTDKAGE